MDEYANSQEFNPPTKEILEKYSFDYTRANCSLCNKSSACVTFMFETRTVSFCPMCTAMFHTIMELPRMLQEILIESYKDRFYRQSKKADLS